MLKLKSSQMHTHSPNAVCQKADGSCFLGQERSAGGGIHATRDHNNVTNILQNTKKTA
jgi:hypothetical protein